MFGFMGLVVFCQRVQCELVLFEVQGLVLFEV